MEGILLGCKGSACNVSCCSAQRMEVTKNEFATIQQLCVEDIRKQGVMVDEKEDMVVFTSCSDGQYCKFLKRSDDLRPLDCKIFPYILDWELVDDVARVYYFPEGCPARVDQNFKEEVEMLITRDLRKIYGKEFVVEFVDTPEL